MSFEAGYGWREGTDATDRVAWVGGQRTPVVSVHLLPLDVGLMGGVAWDGDDLGLLAGVRLAITF